METTRKLAAVLALAVVATAGAVPAASSAPQTPSGFTIVASPKVKGLLYSVAAASANDVVAVGTRGSRGLIEQWNGGSWQIATAPIPKYSALQSVSAGNGAIWAVGYYAPHGSDNTRALVEQQTGSSWVRVPVPKNLEVSNLNAVHVFSDTDVWAGGASSFNHVLVHYNGSTWTNVSDVPFSGEYNRIDGLAGAGSSDVFAMGTWKTRTRRGACSSVR